MKSITSFVDKGILMNNLKRFWWVGVGHLLALIFLIPLQILNNMPYILKSRNLSPHTDIYVPGYVPGFGDELILLVIIVPVIICVLLFRYMHVKKSCVFMHSLPIKREVIYNSNIISGLVNIVIPVVLVTIINTVIVLLYDITFFLSLKYIWFLCGVIILSEIMMFLSCGFVGMFTGFTISHGILTYIFLLLPMGVYELVLSNLKYLIYGFSHYDLYSKLDFIEMISPLSLVLNGNLYRYHIGNSEKTSIILIILFSVVFYVLGKIAYKKRKTEYTAVLLTFNWVKPIFKYGVTVCVMLVSFHGFVRSGFSGILLGYLINSLLAYCICEVLINKSISAVKNIKGYFVYFCIIGISMLVIYTDIIGYQSYVPKVQEVESVYFDDFMAPKGYRFYYENEENIDTVIKLNNEIVEDININRWTTRNTKAAVFVYKLKSGKEVVRRYNTQGVREKGSYKEQYDKYVKRLTESLEYKRVNYDIFKVDEKDITNVVIRSNIDSSKRVTIGEEEHIKQLLKIVRKEVEDMSYEEMSSVENWGKIEFNLEEDDSKEYGDEKEDRSIYLSWNKSFKRLYEFLEDKGYLNKARLIADDVDYIVVEKAEDSDRYSDGNTKKIRRLEVIDKEEIEKILEVYQEHEYLGRDADKYYLVGIYSKNKSSNNFLLIKKEKAPMFINQYFQE